MSKYVSFQGHSIVSCGILRRELTYLETTSFLDADQVFYTEPGLHANRDELKAQLTRQLGNARTVSQHVIVVFGDNCHPDIDQITRGTHISRVDAEDCIDVLADLETRKAMSGGKTGSMFWLTPGWLDHVVENRYVWERIYKGHLGWDAADANVNFGTYRKAIFLDPQPLNVYDEYTPQNILDFSGWTRLTVVRHEVTLARFKRLLFRCVQETTR